MHIAMRFEISGNHYFSIIIFTERIIKILMMLPLLTCCLTYGEHHLLARVSGKCLNTVSVLIISWSRVKWDLLFFFFCKMR